MIGIGEQVSREKISREQFSGIYQDFFDVLGLELTVKIHENYKGLQVTFPTRLYAKEYIIKLLKEEYTGSNLKDLARKYGYSERWVRKLIDS